MNAVGYLRLSTKDQSKSLEYQESIIRDYCKRNKLKILEFFKDNGESSYTFERRNYLELEKFIKRHKGKCQYLIVLDHDRFSRNLPQALMKIAELEQKYNVKVISTNESIDVDTSDADVFMKRAFDYLIANRELLTIKNRTRQGIRNAKENGRYLGRAPFGCQNIKNLVGCTIEINNSQSFIIKKIFQEYDMGVPLNLIHKNVISLGFKNKGNSAVKDILENCTYAGLIKIVAFKNSPEKYVKAIHNPIVSEIDFWRIQKLLKNKRQQKTRENEDFPLRGIIKCPCGQNLTAGWTTGRKKHYLYYKCVKHPGTNIPGKEMHKKFEEILKNITLQQHQVALLNNALSVLLDQEVNKQSDSKKEKSKAIKVVDRKIVQLEEKFITNQISNSIYKDWKRRFDSDKAIVENTFREHVYSETKHDCIIKKLCSQRVQLYRIYRISTVLEKHSLIRLIFKDSLIWDDGTFTTSYFNNYLQFNLLKRRMKALLVVREINLSTIEITNDPLRLDNQPKRRARRITDRKVKSKEIEKESQFIDLIAQLIIEIIKNGSKVPAQG